MCFEVRRIDVRGSLSNIDTLIALYGAGVTEMTRNTMVLVGLVLCLALAGLQPITILFALCWTFWTGAVFHAEVTDPYIG